MGISKGLVLILSILAIVGFTGCGKKIQVKQEQVSLDFSLKELNIAQDKKVNRLIDVVSPEWSSKNQFKYQEETIVALQQGFMELLTKKGFNTFGPVSTFDDLTYTDKKNAYLAIVPKLSFEAKLHPTSKQHEGVVYTETGTITIEGELYIQLVEPMTKQAMMNKRINLSDLGIEESYTFQQHAGSKSDSMLFQILDNGTAPDSIENNFDAKLAKATSEFYIKAMKKINAYLDREELLSYESDILKLKGLKRF